MAKPMFSFEDDSDHIELATYYAWGQNLHEALHMRCIRHGTNLACIPQVYTTTDEGE
jgi:hypothetical protein